MEADFNYKQYREIVKPINSDTKLLRVGLVGSEVVWGKEIPMPPDCFVPKTATIQIYENMLKIRVPSQQPSHLIDARRGAVSLEFGGKKRKRFLDKFNAWVVPGVNLVFVHLTYPSEYDQDWHTWKLHLKTFKEHLQRRFPEVQGFWKLELQRRGAPHYHLVLDLMQKCSIRRFRMWLDAVWARIAHDLDQYGGKYACRAEIVTSIRHARNYVAKYMGKVSFAPVNDDGEVIDSSGMRDTIGRLWGVVGKPNCPVVAERMIDRQAVNWYRLRLALELKKRGARGYKGLINGAAGQSFTVYGVGVNSDNRYMLAGELCDLLEFDWLDFEGKTESQLWLIERLITGMGGANGVKVGQNCTKSLHEDSGGGGG